MRALRSAAAVIASLALLVGVPWLLSATIGNPLDRVPDLLAGDVNDHVVLAALAAALYVAWAQFAVAFAVELLSALRRTPMPRRIPGVFAGQQGLARALVSGALLLLPVTAATVVPAAQAIALTTPHPPATPVTGQATHPTTGSAAAVAVAGPTRDVVLTDDGPRTWWDLAAEHLGDGAQWRDLWDLNRGRTQPDGTVLSTERVVLQPGWTVLVPDTHPTEAGAPKLVTDVTDDPVGGDNREVTVTVRPGDTLSEIAADHGAADWTTVWPSNTGRTEPDGAWFTDPDYIEPGWTVTIPTPPVVGDNDGHSSAMGDNAAHKAGDNGGDTLVEVAAGDTLSQIAADRHVPLDAIVAANLDRTQGDGSRLTDPDDIRPGWTILIPNAITNTATHPAEEGPVTTRPSPPSAATAAPPMAPDQATSPGTRAATASGGASARPSSPAQPQVSTAPTSAPATIRGEASPAASDQTGASEHGAVAVWVAGAGLLAGGALLALVRHRRRQFRYRAPGRSITQTPAELRDAERALLTAGPAGMRDVTVLDRALRGLTRAAAQGRCRLPDVTAARLTSDDLTLTLAAPNLEPPDPWTADEDGTTWTLHRGDTNPHADDDDGGHVEDSYAPYPTLVSVGHTAAGEHWLLDLEQIGYLALTGDPDRCLDLARFLAAELAHNAWSDMVDVTLVGFGDQMTGLNPERLTHTDDLDTAARAATRALTLARDGRDVTHGSVLDDRSDPGTWDLPAANVTLIAPTQACDAEGVDALSVLVDELRGQTGRSAVAVVVVGGDPLDHEEDAGADGGWVVQVDSAGALRIPALGVELIAQQLPEREAADLAALLALAAATQDQPMPASRGDQPWDDLSDAAGSPLPQLTLPGRSTGDPAGPARIEEAVPAGEAVPDSVSSALPLPPRAYLDRTAADQADLDTLAPPVPDGVRERIETSDTDLDEDLADWYDDTTTRPRVTVLGSIQVRAQGDLPPGRPRLAWHTEVVTYLATRPRGATVEAFGTALWPTEPDIVGRPKLRNSIYTARRWLGVDPGTGQDYLPSNTRNGGGTYRIVGGLLDAELFRRLRLRGVARGTRGIADLQAALDLVAGVPFDRQRPGGYGWLVDPPLHHEYTAAIVDVAHLLATHHLAAGDPSRAAEAANVALLAGSSADTPLLDLVASSEALGNTTEADAYVKRIMGNHDADVEEDLPPRTAAVLHRRRWLPPAA